MAEQSLYEANANKIQNFLSRSSENDPHFQNAHVSPNTNVSSESRQNINENNVFTRMEEENRNEERANQFLSNNTRSFTPEEIMNRLNSQITPNLNLNGVSELNLQIEYDTTSMYNFQEAVSSENNPYQKIEEKKEEMELD